MINNIKIQANGIIEEFQVDLLADLQEAVGGHKIEPISMSGKRVMLVNFVSLGAQEEGLLKKLPPNVGASNLVGRNIVGSAVIINRADLLDAQRLY